MRVLDDIPVLENIPVLVRGALNVPVEQGSVTNEYRLRRALPTLRYLSHRGARVVLIGHFDKPDTGTLAPVAADLSRLLPRVTFFPETTGPTVRAAIRAMHPGEILFLENLRRDRGEMANDPAFARELAALADVFVQDSFDTCHRSHASIVGVPTLLPSYGGLLLHDEVQELTKALAPAHPSLAVIGGAKFSTKEAVLAALLKTYDHVFVGGALANDFLKASGKEVGMSLVSSGDTGRIKELLANPRLVLPSDVLVVTADAADPTRAQARVVGAADVKPDEVILDHGPLTSVLLNDLVRKAQTILWNGPLGNYENGFTNATDVLAQAIAGSSARSVVGGGDTIASIEKLGIFSKFSFVSTGGGAMLEFLARGTLPGITALG